MCVYPPPRRGYMVCENVGLVGSTLSPIDNRGESEGGYGRPDFGHFRVGEGCDVEKT